MLHLLFALFRVTYSVMPFILNYILSCKKLNFLKLTWHTFNLRLRLTLDSLHLTFKPTGVYSIYLIDLGRVEGRVDPGDNF